MTDIDKKRELKRLQTKVAALKPAINMAHRREIARQFGMHYNTITNYLDGFGADDVVLSGIIDYARSQKLKT